MCGRSGLCAAAAVTQSQVSDAVSSLSLVLPGAWVSGGRHVAEAGSW